MINNQFSDYDCKLLKLQNKNYFNKILVMSFMFNIFYGRFNYVNAQIKISRDSTETKG
jgi:hypothetical protein